jgi:RNA polymerase sigma-70 factor (ECF subfamily)
MIDEKGESQLSDQEVIARVMAGDTALFEVLMRRYNQRVYRVARSILGNDSEAEDVMQESYVRAYAHLDQFAGRSTFSTWLTKIAVYEALARARRSSRFESVGIVPEAEDRGMMMFASGDRDPEKQMFDHEVKSLLEAAIDGLPRDYRSVFAFREIEGMDTAETAECLGVSEEVVKTRLHRARALIRRDLYRRAGATSAAAFQFHLSRCDRVVNAVLRHIHGSAPPFRSDPA